MAEGDRFALLLRPALILSILFILSKCIRIMARGRRGKIPPEVCRPVENLHLESERWVETVSRYGGLFHQVAGSAGSLGRRCL